MKRLWMRLGVVAGILGVGGAGVLVAQKSVSSSAKSEVVANAPEQPVDNSDGKPQPIPLGSFGADEGSPASPAGSTNAAAYSNELPPEDASNSARFVNEPASSQYAAPQYADSQNPEAQYPETQYAGSPAVYSVNDAGNESVSNENSEAQYAEAAPSSSYAPAGSYASRYGDPVSDNESGGASLRSPQELAEPPSPYGRYDESAPQPTDTESYAPSQYRDTEPVASSEAPIEPPPMRRESAPAAAKQASVQPAAQPTLLTRDSFESPAAGSSYGELGSSAAVAAVVASPLASNTPGDRVLEGAQTPTLTLEKRAPSEVSVGQAAPFKIIVRNVGNVTAHGVVLTDRVPQGTKLVDASPDFTETADGTIAWQLGDLDPGDQAQVSIELMPLVEGEIGSVAQLTFRAQASVRTVSTKPQLVVKHTGPAKVLIGEEVVFDIILSNPGSGATTGIILEEDVPEGLAHVAGERLEYEVGTLRPKEEKPLQLVLRADKAGIVKNVLRVKADAGLEATDQITLEVIAPQLQVTVGGPRTRYLERQVTYEIEVANPGTSTAYDIELVTFLPKGLKFVSADNKGSYDAGRHAIYWSLAELAAEDSGSVKVTALPIETGEQKLRVEGTANLNLSAEMEHTTNVQGLTELEFSVQDIHDPIEVGSETIYEIRVVNNGNKAATNVEVMAQLSEQLTPIKGEGPTKVVVEGQQVLMELLPRIGPREEVVYRVAARGVGAGDHVFQVQLASDEVPTPVTKQESTKVYADE